MNKPEPSNKMINKQIIFILDDVHDVLVILKNYLIEKLKNVEIHTFTKYDTLIKHPLVKKASLFIIDIELNDINKTGDQAALELHRLNHAPFLFMSGLGYNFDSFEGYDLTYDFVKKPFDMKQTLNRIKVLLKVALTYDDHIDQQTKLKVSLRELFDYTNIYLLILDEDMKIKLCSYKLWKDLGFNAEAEIIGLNWNQFTPKKDLDRLHDIHFNVINDTSQYQNSLREVTNKILTTKNTTITVKWFNSRIANSHTYAFSIGIPYNRNVTEADEIESIRAYWKHIVDQDQTTLKALKSSMKERDDNANG